MRGMTITTARNQIPSVRMGIVSCPQTVNAGESQEMVEPHYTVGENGHCQQPLEQTVFTCQRKKTLSDKLNLVLSFLL